MINTVSDQKEQIIESKDLIKFLTEVDRIKNLATIGEPEEIKFIPSSAPTQSTLIAPLLFLNN